MERAERQGRTGRGEGKGESTRGGDIEPGRITGGGGGGEKREERGKSKERVERDRRRRELYGGRREEKGDRKKAKQTELSSILKYGRFRE